MPQRSKIELLGLVETVIQMYFSQKKKQEEIVKHLRAQGYRVSKGSVGRAIKSHAKRLKEIEKTQNWAKALIAATNNTPRLDVANAGLQLVAGKLAEELSEIENFSNLEADEKAVLLAKITRAIGLAANVELNFERGRKQGIFESKKKLEAVGKELGISDDKMNALKAKVFGIGVNQDGTVQG